MVTRRTSISLEAKSTANQIISNHRPSSAHKKVKVWHTSAINVIKEINPSSAHIKERI